MKDRLVDLHTHTTHSDGVLSPSALLEKAHKYQITAISITDHDTIAAYIPSTYDAAKKFNVELIPGIEFSTQFNGRSYHILGLLIDTNNSQLKDITARLQESRISFTKRQCEALIAQGWEIDIDTLLQSEGTITKANIARSVLSNPANKQKLFDVFEKTPLEGQFIEALMKPGGPASVARIENEKLSPQEAIQVIHDSGGLAILAHPGFNLIKGESIDELSEHVQEWGIDGIEAINIQHDKSNFDQEVDHTELLLNFAKERGLVISGGSDYHGAVTQGKYVDLGNRNYPERHVDYSVLQALKDRKNSRRGDHTQ